MMRATVLGLAILLLSGCGPTVMPAGPTSASSPTTPVVQQQPSVAQTPASGDRREVRVVRVLDGDTFDATDGVASLRVRVLGIDAPEISHDGSQPDCGADAATAALKRLIGGQVVVVEHDQRSAARDQYGRDLAYVTATDGVDVGLRLTEQGLAEAWYPSSVRAPSRDDTYRLAMARARDAKIGAWKTCPKIGR